MRTCSSKFSSRCRNSLEAACQKFHRMVKAILSCSFLFALEPRYLKKQKTNIKTAFSALGVICSKFSHFPLYQFPFYFSSPIFFSQSSSREQTHNTVSPSSGPKQAVHSVGSQLPGTTGKRPVG